MNNGIDYESSIVGECASDIDLTKLSNATEIEFVKRMRLYQDTVTHLQQNLEYCKCFYGLVRLNKTFSSEYGTFFSVFLNNNTYAIINEISNMFAESNALKIRTLNTLCGKNSFDIFGKAINNSVLKEFVRQIDEAEKIYFDKIHNIRIKFFAHFDERATDYNYISNCLKEIDLDDISKIIVYLKKALTLLWEQYNGKKMCFTLHNHTDFIKMIHVLGEEYGDTSFTDIKV